MEKASEKKNAKKKNSKFKLMIAVMLTSALFLAELYLMITAASNITLIAGIGACILVTVSFVVSAVLDCVDEKGVANKEQYDNIYKSEKASYMLLKKRLEALSKQVEALENNSSNKDNGSAEIIKAQKSIAKIAMGKTKETQDRLFIELNNLEASLNDSVHDLAKRLSGFQEEIERLADHIAKINTEAIQEAARGGYTVKEVPVQDVLEDKILEEEVFVEEEPVENELDLDFQGLDLEEPEPMPEPIPVPAAAPADDGGKMNQDDIAALIASMTGGDAAPVEEPEPAPLPLSDDPNKMMTPEEIAALLASM